MLRIGLALLALLILVFPVFGQEAPVMSAVSEQTQVETLTTNLFALIYNATYLPFAAGMVTLLVSVTKRLPIFIDVSGAALSLFYTVILWAVWTSANELGYGNQFESITSSLTTIGAAVLGVTLTPIAAGRLYSAANKYNVALLGYARSKGYSEQPLTLSELDKAVYSRPTPMVEAAMQQG